MKLLCRVTSIYPTTTRGFLFDISCFFCTAYNNVMLISTVEQMISECEILTTYLTTQLQRGRFFLTN